MRIRWLITSALLAVIVMISGGSAFHPKAAVSTLEATAAPTQAISATPTLTAQQIVALPEVQGDILGVHDPSMIKAGGKYYIFSTGAGILIHCSDDMLTWKSCGWIFPVNPFWLKVAVPGVGDLWAPDISFFAGKYHVYYAASTFGSNHSIIGLLTNVTLDQADPNYKWIDEKQVITSDRGDNFNAIDPNLVIDSSGQTWLAFGSFWDGIKMRKINAATGKLATDDTTLYSLAKNTLPPYPIEGAYITHRGKYYYLFVSYDFCCRGVKSNYKIMVGRSASVTGPYVDQDGKPMLEGNATLVYKGSERWRGPGHNAIFVENDTYWMLYHSYDAEHNGTPTLRIEALQWDGEDWPYSLNAVLGR